VSGPFFLGIDGGTEGLRAGVFAADGTRVGTAAVGYPTRFPHPGWAEQDPRDWWAALGRAVREAVRAAEVAPSELAGLAVDTTCCSVVALDARGKPLREALIWMDVRSGAQAARIMATGDPALAVNGGGRGPLSAEWLLPKALWLLENQPEVFRAARYVCEYQDFLNYKLTGRMVASLNNAAIRWHYGAHGGGYPVSLMEKARLDGLLERLPEVVLPMGEPIGGLTEEAAHLLGLPAGLPVAQGGADAFVAMLGLGAVRPGALAFITGSSHLHLGVSERPFHAPGVWGTYADAVVPGRFVVEGGQTSTGSVVSWLKGLLGADASFEALNRDAAALPPGAEGLLVLEHFQGNRTPHTDPYSRGVIAGLTLKHRAAHLFRAVLEGVAFGSELVLRTMREVGFAPQEVVIAGGATRSDLWLQIHADVSGIPFALTACPDAPMLGSAMLAAVGAGYLPDLEAAAAAMVRRTRTVEPDPKRHEAYRELFGLYCELYPKLSPLLHGSVRYAQRTSEEAL
jgi:ribulokinase